jgi:ribonuclease HII
MLEQSDGLRLEVGIDEAGRGCLAGPVVAAAVSMPIFDELDEAYYIVKMIKDSKKMTPKNRDVCREFIESVAIDWGVGIATNDEIDQINILKATHLAMHRALDNLNITPDFILVDGNSFIDYYDDNNELIDYTCVIGGDNKYFNIACASILAKEYHDKMIRGFIEENDEYDTHYDWNRNVCYGTEKHRIGIEKWGLSKYHRKTFGICRTKHVTC